jgi:hypothetical protein
MNGQDDDMIDGFKLIFHQIAFGVCVLVAGLPIWNTIYAYATNQIATNGWTFCVDSLGNIVLGVQMLYWVIISSIMAAFIYTFFLAVQKREYNAQFSRYGDTNIYGDQRR